MLYCPVQRAGLHIQPSIGNCAPSSLGLCTSTHVALFILHCAACQSCSLLLVEVDGCKIPSSEGTLRNPCATCDTADGLGIVNLACTDSNDPRPGYSCATSCTTGCTRDGTECCTITAECNEEAKAICKELELVCSGNQGGYKCEWVRARRCYTFKSNNSKLHGGTS
jgi:hypothetical protein